MGFCLTTTQKVRQNLLAIFLFFVSRVLVIRFQRAGRKKSPFYRIVVAEKSRAVKGRFVEKVGHYNPVTNPKEVSLNTERIEHWISVGATPSQTAARLFHSNGMTSAEKFIAKRVMKPSRAEREAIQKAKEEGEEKEVKNEKKEDPKENKNEENQTKETPQENIVEDKTTDKTEA